jgi:hypothetical protein
MFITCALEVYPGAYACGEKAYKIWSKKSHFGDSRRSLGGSPVGLFTAPKDACIRRSYPQTVLLFKMILIKMIPIIFSKDT